MVDPTNPPTDSEDGDYDITQDPAAEMADAVREHGEDSEEAWEAFKGFLKRRGS